MNERIFCGGIVAAGTSFSGLPCALVLGAYALCFFVSLLEHGRFGDVARTWRKLGRGAGIAMPVLCAAFTVMSQKQPSPGADGGNGGTGAETAAADTRQVSDAWQASDARQASDIRQAPDTRQAPGARFSGGVQSGGSNGAAVLSAPLSDPGNWWRVEGRDATDTDGDGMPDGWERMFGLDPENPEDALEDPERDSLVNLAEFINRTHPKRRDTDGDGMPDFYEAENLPLLCPWLPDDTEDADNDGLDNFHEYALGTLPGNPDSNGSGRSDGAEAGEGVDATLALPDWAAYGTAQVSVRVDGLLAARRAGVVIGHVTHSGVPERTYALAAGTRYPLAVVDLDPGNTNACAGTVRLMLDNGTFIHGFTNEFAVSFPLGPGDPPAVPPGTEVTVVGIDLGIPDITWLEADNSQTLDVTASFVPDGETIPGEWQWSVSSGAVIRVSDGGASARVRVQFPAAEAEAPQARGVRMAPAGAEACACMGDPCGDAACGCACHAGLAGELDPPGVTAEKGDRKNTREVYPPDPPGPEEEDPWDGKRFIARSSGGSEEVKRTYALAFSTNAVGFSWYGHPEDTVREWEISGDAARFIKDGQEVKKVANSQSVSVLPKETFGNCTITARCRIPTGGTVTRTAEFRVITLAAEPVMTFAFADGLVNPSGLFMGSSAVMVVAVSPNVDHGDVSWETAVGAVSVAGHARAGLYEKADVSGTSLGGDTVRMKIADFCGDPPAFDLEVHLAQSPVPVHFVFLCGANGEHAGSESQISGLISGANAIFQQAGMSFYNASTEYHTNASWHANSANLEVQLSITGILQGTGGLEVYFVPQLDEGRPGKNYGSRGILLTDSPGQRIFAHELGHPCGLRDIYNRHKLTTLTVTGPVVRSRLPLDWNNGPGPQEYYTRGLEQAAVNKRLLMYGYTDGGVDIPAGRVYGLSVRTYLYSGTVSNVIDRLNIPVGLSDINRTPSHQ
jgi:hypothetical protein